MGIVMTRDFSRGAQGAFLEGKGGILPSGLSSMIIF